MDRIVARQPPLHHSATRTVHDNRHLDALIAQPNRDLAHAPELRKLAEHQMKRLAYSSVWIQLQPIVGAVHVTDGYGRMEIPACRFEAQSFLLLLRQYLRETLFATRSS